MSRAKWFHVLFLVVLCSLVYSNSLKGGFHYDDFHVLNEVNTKLNISNLRFFTWLTFYANALPEKTNAVFYHLTNLFIHLCAGISIYFIVLLIIKDKKSYIPFFVSALFLVHPLATEPVNYITARFTQMAALFSFLALIFFILYVKGRKFVYIALTLTAFFMGVYSKEVGMFYAVAGIFVYSVYFLDWKKHMSGKKVLIISGGSFLFLLFLFLFTGALDRFRNPLLWKYFLIQNRVFALKYLRLMILPVGLSVEHGAMTLAGFKFDAGVLLGLAVNVSAIAYAVVIRNRKKIISFSIIWIYIFHIPYFFLTSGETAVEYRTYPMLFGYVLLMGYCIANYIAGKRRQKIIFTAIVIVFGILTVFRNSQWGDELTLWTKTLKTNPNSRRALNESGKAYLRKGLHDKAIANFSRAIELEPSNYEAYNNRGNVYKEKGMADLAIADYSTAVGINPQYYEAYNNRGVVYGSKGMHEKAVADFTGALEIQPGNISIYYNRGLVYRNIGFHDRAMADFSRVIELNPAEAGAYLNRGIVYGRKELYDKALADFNRTIELNPQSGTAYKYRSIVYGKLGRKELANRDREKAGLLLGK